MMWSSMRINGVISADARGIIHIVQAHELSNLC